MVRELRHPSVVIGEVGEGVLAGAVRGPVQTVDAPRAEERAADERGHRPLAPEEVGVVEEPDAFRATHEQGRPAQQP